MNFKQSKSRLAAALTATLVAAGLLQAAPALAAAPDMTITVSDRYLANNETSLVTFTAAAAITGFDASDIQIVSGTGTFTNFTETVAGTVFTATYTPASWVNGSVTFQVPAGAYSDGVDSNASAITTIIWFDDVSPSIYGFYAMKQSGNYFAGETIELFADVDDNLATGATVDVTLNSGAVVTLAMTDTASEMSGNYVVGANDSTNGAALNVVSYTLNSSLKDSYGNLMVTTTVPGLTDNISASASIVIGVAVAPTFDVVYNTNGATSGSVPAQSTAYDSGETVTVLGNSGQLRKNGFVHNGWNTAADGTGTRYTGGTTFVIDDVDVILYAQWKALATKNKGKAFAFDPNSSVVSKANKSAIKSFGSSLKNKSGLKVTVTGYAFGRKVAESKAIATARAKETIAALKAAGVTGTFVIKVVTGSTKRSADVAATWIE